MPQQWTAEDWMRFVQERAIPGHAGGYAAMYSSEWDAIVTDPRLMQVPVDDHLVHRGDGVFETLLARDGGLYNLDAHLRRLQHSAAFIGMQAAPLETLRGIILETFRAAGLQDALGRLLLGRGPGGFSVDPAECPTPSLYLVVYPGGQPFMEKVPQGASVSLSAQPVKPGGLATVKTCNYLPNVLMKAEATKAGVHFVAGMDENGFLTESYTENLVLLDMEGVLRMPPALNHLPGTTQRRVRELADEAGIPCSDQAFTPEEALRGKELFLIGTTAYVTSVVEFKGRPIGSGLPGPVGRQLHDALEQDVLSNSSLRSNFLD